MTTKNIMIVGVGGQGTLLTSRILGGIITKAGYDVKLSEVHGMATPSVLSGLYLVKLRRINFHQQGGEGRRCGGIVDRRQRSLMEI